MVVCLFVRLYVLLVISLKNVRFRPVKRWDVSRPRYKSRSRMSREFRRDLLTFDICADDFCYQTYSIMTPVVKAVSLEICEKFDLMVTH